MIPGAEPYGNDRGVRIAYTNLSPISRLWKASTEVNSDADMGIDIKELKELCKVNAAVLNSFHTSNDGKTYKTW